MAGRPTKLTDGRMEKIIERLRAGCTRSAAAESVGVHRSQMGRWIEGSATFATAVMCAEAEAEEKMTACVVSAADEDWRASEAWLKRRRRDEWGDTPKGATITSDKAGGFSVTLSWGDIESAE